MYKTIENTAMPRNVPPLADQTSASFHGMNDDALVRGDRRSCETGADSGRDNRSYQILHLQGRGTMGSVYKARQRSLNRIVAVKIMHDGSNSDLQRFRSEAEAIARLHHRNIVQVYEAGEWEGKPFFSMEFVERTLADVLDGKPRDSHRAAKLIAGLARAIHHAHEVGIVHRDLKPANVLLHGGREMAIDECTPKIADFGLAKYLDGGSGQTCTGLLVGTPRYMSPEQAKGDTRSVGPLSDVYSLGAILYEMLSGKAPFRGSTVFATLDQVRSREATPLRRYKRSVPRDLETICLKCLEKDPKQRYQSAQALADDIERFLQGKPIHARPATWTTRAFLWCRRPERIRDAGIVTIFLAVVVFLEHCIVGALVALDTGVYQSNHPGETVLGLLFVMAIFDLPLSIIGWYTVQRKTLAVWGGLVMHLLSFAWLMGGLLGAAIVLDSIDSGGVFRNFEARLSLFLFPLVVTVIAILGNVAALAAFRAYRRTRQA